MLSTYDDAFKIYPDDEYLIKDKKERLSRINKT